VVIEYRRQIEAGPNLNLTSVRKFTDFRERISSGPSVTRPTAGAFYRFTCCNDFDGTLKKR
jgi:hypothetical protein